jgi:AcrR family transcriptional regulator
LIQVYDAGMSAASMPAGSAAADVEHHAPRERLLQAGLRLFAQQGFAKTSTRELAEAAGVNVAAISYYFGDKAGLYRAAFFEPLCGREREPAWLDGATLTLEQALAAFFADLLAPLRDGDTPRLCMKLRFREMFEPTGLWDEELSRDIAPMHAALVAALQRHFGVAHADDELHRLAICIAGLGVHLHVGRDLVDALAPSLLVGTDAVDDWCDRLVRYALAMVDAEARRRGGQGGHA